MLWKKMIAVAALVSAASPAYAVTDLFEITFEAPGVQETTRTVRGKLVETFTGRAASNATFTNVLNPNFSVSYSTVATLPAGDNGGAGGTGRYMRVAGGAQETITIANASGLGTNYFGMYISAFDPGNFVDFRRGGQTVFSFGPADVLAALGACPAGPYCGNPSAPFKGAVQAEPFAFVNFVNRSGFFDQVVIRQASPTNPNAGYQTDNHTFGNVPEPASWAMLTIGFGLAGAAMRRKSKLVAA